jgi:2-dehydropantoate 2-reductase
MQIAIVGAGRIGSTFAFYLARAGHDVTLVARGARLATLQSDPAIETVSGERAAIQVADAIDLVKRWDLVLVTVLAHQVDDILPSLHLSAAKKIMFMFNTVESLTRLREAVDAARFEFGFPTVIAAFVDGKLKCSVDKPGQITTVTSEPFRSLFAEAGIPAEVSEDMESFLRSHAAFVVPLMAMGQVVYARGVGLSWGEAKRYARAMAEGFGLVQRLGNSVTPSVVSLLSRLPPWLATALMWGASRLGAVRDLGAMEPTEVRELIDAMTAEAPEENSELLAIRP